MLPGAVVRDPGSGAERSGILDSAIQGFADSAIKGSAIQD